MKKIPIHEPYFKGNEKKNLIDCIDSNWVSGSGKYINILENKIKKITGSKYVIPVLNGTVGLHTSLILSDVKANDEVIVPTITFVASVNVIKYVGAFPVFMDVDNDLNIDENKCIEFLNKHTFKYRNFTYNKITKRKVSAIIIVHTFGNAAKIDKIKKLCRSKNIKLIEDAAESLGTYYIKNKIHTGTIGDFGVISFNGNKIVTSGNGGVILTQKKNYYKRAKYIVNQAKNSKEQYIHNEIGYNYCLSNLSAAVAVAQIENLNIFLKKKKKIHNFYKKKFRKFKNFQLLEGPSYAKNNYWINLLNYKKLNLSSKLIHKFFHKNKIEYRAIWYPNHLQKKFKSYQKFKIFKANYIYKDYICLPSSYNLSFKNINKICNLLINKLK